MARSVGSGEKMASSSSISTPTNLPFSWTAWIYVNSGGAGTLRNIWRMNNTGAYVNNTNFIAILQGGTSDTTASPSTNVWVHVGGSTTSLGLTLITTYMNGTSFGTTGGSCNSETNAITIASDNFSQPLNGRIQEFALWNIALTANEFAALAKGARIKDLRPPGSFIVYYPLDGLQSPEPDFSGNAKNLTLTGTAKAFGPPVMQFTPRWPQVLAAVAAPPPVNKFFVAHL